MDKNILRSKLRKARQDFAKKRDSCEYDLANPHAKKFTELLKNAHAVAVYRPIQGEPDPIRIARAAWRHDVIVALPWLPHTEAGQVEHGARMTFRRWRCDDALERARFGFEQPTPGSEIVAPDLVVTPLVGFDEAGNRLGQGAGYYDGAFEALPDAFRVGLAWSVQQVDALPTDPWDKPLDMILTECACLIPAHSRLIGL